MFPCILRYSIVFRKWHHVSMKCVCDARRHLLLTKLHVLALHSSQWMYLHDRHMPCVSYIITKLGAISRAVGSEGKCPRSRSRKIERNNSWSCLWILSCLEAISGATTNSYCQFKEETNLPKTGESETLGTSGAIESGNAENSSLMTSCNRRKFNFRSYASWTEFFCYL